ncbi:MAG: hypothetical protein HYW90_01525 [Candidatus Sungbacteria bacterium]|nr:hypothetical protein [Candidatus Sungbacteria bacterium]
MENKSKTIIIATVVVLVVAGAGFWYWSKSKQAPSSKEASSLGGEIFDKTQNQLQGQVPDTNPFKDQRNPLDLIYQNPFE